MANKTNKQKSKISANYVQQQHKKVTKKQDIYETQEDNEVSVSEQFKSVPTYVWYGLAIVIITFLLFARTIPFNLVYCDDDTMILDTKDYNSKLSNIPNSFTKSFFDSNDLYYRPLLRVSLIIDANIGGVSPAMYRFTNVFLHVICSLLVFVFFRKLKYPDIMAFFMGILFAVHPVVSPAVNWISGRNDTLLTVFMLPALIFFISYYESKKKNWLAFGMSILFYALAIFTKEAAILLPVFCVLLVVLYKKEKFLNKKLYPLYIGWAVVTLVWFIMRQHILAGRGEANQLAQFFFDAVKSNYPTIPALFGKIFLPVRMSALANFEAITLISGIVVMIALIVYVTISKTTNKRRIIFGLLWFCLFISPTLIARIKDFDFDYAEHRIYLPMIGMVLVLLEIVSSLKIDFKKPVVIGVTSGVLLLLTGTTFAYQSTFKDAFSFWGHFIDYYPEKTRGYIGVGKQWFMRDSLNKVEELMRRGITVKPDYKYWYSNLSSIYIKQKKYKEAEINALKGLEFDHSDASSSLNLALALVAEGDAVRAIDALQYAAVLNKDNPQLYMHLGDIYLSQHKYNEAEQAYLQTINIMPKMLPIYTKLGNLYSETKQYDKAIYVLNRAVELDPNSVQAYLNLGAIYADHQKYKEAESMWLKVLQINPNAPEAYSNLIMLYHLLKDDQKARQFAIDYLRKGGKLPPVVIQAIGLAKG